MRAACKSERWIPSKSLAARERVSDAGEKKF